MIFPHTFDLIFKVDLVLEQISNGLWFVARDPLKKRLWIISKEPARKEWTIKYLQL